jgi:hypothetical protein
MRWFACAIALLMNCSAAYAQNRRVRRECRPGLGRPAG